MVLSRRWLLAYILLLVAAIVAACAGGRDSAQKQTGPFAVGTRSITLVDRSRPTKAFGDQPELPERTIVTQLWYPAEGEPSDASTADAPTAEGPFPLIVFNHGQQGQPEQYAASLRQWASAGYVVAAPRHPLTIKGGPGAQFVNDSEDEVADIPFVITGVGEQLSDLVDLDHVGVVGHSSGAIASLAVGFHTCCRDDRIDAVALESVIEFGFDGRYDWSEDVPVLFLHGTADISFKIEQGHDVFEKAEAPKFFLSIADGDHSETFRTGDRSQLSADAVLAFFDRYVKDRKDALDELRFIAQGPLVANFEEED